MLQQVAMGMAMCCCNVDVRVRIDLFHGDVSSGFAGILLVYGSKESVDGHVFHFPRNPAATHYVSDYVPHIFRVLLCVYPLLVPHGMW